MPKTKPAVNDRVAFLGLTGPANTGKLMDVEPCPTWGEMAQVLWDTGETGFARMFDLETAAAAV